MDFDEISWVNLFMTQNFPGLKIIQLHSDLDTNLKEVEQTLLVGFGVDFVFQCHNNNKKKDLNFT